MTIMTVIQKQYFSTLTDMENTELRGNLWEIPDSLPGGVRHQIPRPRYQLCQRLQHSHEGRPS